VDEVRAVLGLAGGRRRDDMEIFGSESALNRRNSSMARVTASGSSLPVVTSPRPSPASIFSLKSVVGERAIPS
jgi:hypothetical protein